METYSAWVHNLDPFLLQFTEKFGIRWYGLAYMVGFIMGAVIMTFIAKRGRRTLPAEQVTDFITYIVLGTMIGARVGYALFYSPDLLTNFSAEFPFWGVLAVWQGGMSSHGGFIGIFLACLLYAKRHKVNWLHLADLTTLGGTIGIFFGRIANFINGELMGRPVSSAVSWAVKFPQDIYHWTPEKGNALLHSTGQVGYEIDRLPKLAGVVDKLTPPVSPDMWTSWVNTYSTSGTARTEIYRVFDQIILQIQNGNEAVRAAIAPYLVARHPSQLYESLLEGLFLFLVLFLVWRKPQKPGVIGGLFLTIYAFVRIFCEHFRMPDAEIGFQLLGLTRGQWISSGQIFFGVALLIFAATRKSDKIAGWGREAMALRDAEAAAVAASSGGKKKKK